MRVPDGQFSHVRARFPGMVVEITDSQNPEDLKLWAKRYLRGSNGQIRVVLGIDLGDPSQSPAVFPWQTRHTKEGIVIENTINNRVGMIYHFMNRSKHMTDNSQVI